MAKYYAIRGFPALGIYRDRKVFKEHMAHRKGNQGKTFKSFPEALEFITNVKVPKGTSIKEGWYVEKDHNDDRHDPEVWRVLFFDGGLRPKVAGCGAFLADPYGNVLWEGSSVLNLPHSALFAEFQGLVLGLEVASSRGLKSLIVIGDNKTVIDAMQGTSMKSPDKHIGKVQKRARQLARNFDHLHFYHVSRKLNNQADALVRKAYKGFENNITPTGKWRMGKLFGVLVVVQHLLHVTNI